MDESAPKTKRRPPSVTCTATSKQSGQRCKRTPAKGKKVCRMHGGATPPEAAKNATKHGLYAMLGPEDADEVEAAKEALRADSAEAVMQLAAEQYVRIKRALGRVDPKTGMLIVERVGQQVRERVFDHQTQQHEMVVTRETMTQRQVDATPVIGATLLQLTKLVGDAADHKKKPAPFVNNGTVNVITEQTAAKILQEEFGDSGALPPIEAEIVDGGGTTDE
jgi:hypothetical protein